MSPDNRIIEEIRKKGWRDILRESGVEYSTLFSARRKPNRVDYVFSMGNSKTVSGFVPQITQQNNTASYCTESISNYGSDHLPIVAVTDLLKKSSNL